MVKLRILRRSLPRTYKPNVVWQHKNRFFKNPRNTLLQLPETRTSRPHVFGNKFSQCSDHTALLARLRRVTFRGKTGTQCSRRVTSSKKICGARRRPNIIRARFFPSVLNHQKPKVLQTPLTDPFSPASPWTLGVSPGGSRTFPRHNEFTSLPFGPSQ